MAQLVRFLLEHGYAVLFVFVLAEQLGLPIPAMPVLLAMGALIGRGEFGGAQALILAASAASFSAVVWFHLGRRGGNKVVRLVCRLSLEPDSCVRRTTGFFARYGLRMLLVSKFVPGLNTAAPPMAGMARVPLWRFLAWDFAGSLLWAGTFLGIGVLVSSEIERAAEWAARLGLWAVLALLTGLAAYIGWKYYERRRFFNSLRIARLSPEELKSRMDAGETLAIIDLRHPLELESDGSTLPGALRFLPDELEARRDELPLDREIILYCS